MVSKPMLKGPFVSSSSGNYLQIVSTSCMTLAVFRGSHFPDEDRDAP